MNAEVEQVHDMTRNVSLPRRCRNSMINHVFLFTVLMFDLPKINFVMLRFNAAFRPFHDSKLSVFVSMDHVAMDDLIRVAENLSGIFSARSLLNINNENP